MRHRARVIGGAVLAALALTATALMMGTSPASADSQIGWVLDASGSVQCVVKTGTNNHVVCTVFPAGGGAGTVVIDDWLPYACLGGAYMTAGNNAGTPAQLTYQNVSGYYCGRNSTNGTTLHVGTCYNSANWTEGTYTYNPSHIIQGGNLYPNNNGGSSFPNEWLNGGNPKVNCNNVGYSVVGYFIYY